MQATYIYAAQVVRVVDGDTVDVMIDLGFSVSAKIRLRLARINAPEVTGDSKPEGLKSAEWLTQEVSGKAVTIHSKGKDRYGRYIADIWLGDLLVNDELIKLGLAVPYKG